MTTQQLILLTGIIAGLVAAPLVLITIAKLLAYGWFAGKRNFEERNNRDGGK